LNRTARHKGALTAAHKFYWHISNNWTKDD